MRRNDQLATYTECRYCHTSMRLAPSTVASGHGKYCSKACFQKSREATLVCDGCGSSFTRYQSATSRYKGKNFCSKACVYLVRRKPGRIAIKRQRYGTLEFQTARKAVILRDGVCQICQIDTANSVHHKNWRPYDNRLENLVLLCKSCHGRFKREEDWESGRLRIMECSELRGNSQSEAEMPSPALTDAVTKLCNRTVKSVGSRQNAGFLTSLYAGIALEPTVPQGENLMGLANQQATCESRESSETICEAPQGRYSPRDGESHRL